MNKKNFLIFLVFCFFFNVLSSQELYLNDQWKFSIGDDLQWSSPKFDDSRWPVISTAQDWESQGYTYYDGFGWYRKILKIPVSLEKQIKKYGGILIKYHQVDDVDELYFNGHKIGTTGSMPPNFITGFGKRRVYFVPSKYIYFNDKPNVIAVRVYDAVGNGGLITERTVIQAMNAASAIQLSFNFPAKEWVFLKNDPQRLDLTLKNTLKEKLSSHIVFVLKTDMNQPVDSIVFPFSIKANETISLSIPFKLPTPGFYRCSLFVENAGKIGDKKLFNIGFEPEKVISSPNGKPDLVEFWNNTKKELNKIVPDYQMTFMPEYSNGPKNIYHVTMMSFLNVKIEGFYAVPKSGEKFPAIASFMGYGADTRLPNQEANPGFAEFILSVRGQGIQKPINSYREWGLWGLCSKETYYYRGAFMDLIRSIDFLASRPEIDTTKIVAEGGSQGGMFTFAVCALDHRVKAGAPSIPLSDFENYIKVVQQWPTQNIQKLSGQIQDTNLKRFFDVLSYFDVKNMAEWIKCPIYMAAGLQDEMCPNRVNFAVYNNLKTEKKWIIYHDQGHSTPKEWNEEKLRFYREKLEIK